MQSPGSNRSDATASSPDDVSQLNSALEASLIRELREAHRDLNLTLFRGALRPPSLELSSARSFLGRWSSTTRTLEISRAFAVEQPWNVVLEVMKHEMAHQYVDEVLNENADGHGPVFRDVCRRFGIDPKASGIPRDNGGDPEQERVLTRVAGLLALAESPNVNEAQAAMAAAQRLMLKYNIDRSQAGRAPSQYGFRQVGRITGRVSERERLLAGLLGQHFFVEAIWIPAYDPKTGKSGSVLEICGTRANLEMAEYVHAYLTHTAERLWESHKRESGIRSNRDRATYLAGVIQGFRERLASEWKTHNEQGLVWAGDADLACYLRKRHPRIQTVRFGGNPQTEAREQGREAGRNIVLHRPVTSGDSGRGRLLPPGRRH